MNKSVDQSITYLELFFKNNIIISGYYRVNNNLSSELSGFE